MTSSTFVSNIATSNGGGIFSPNATVAIVNTNFNSNYGYYGGAVDSGGPYISVQNSIFSSNYAGGHGGALGSSYHTDTELLQHLLHYL